MQESVPTPNNQEEVEDTSYVDMAEGKSPMEAVREAQVSGDPAKVAEAQAAADEKYIVRPELHNEHVEAKKEHDEAKSREEMEQAFAKMEVKRKEIASEVAQQLQGKDALGVAQAIVNMYRKATPEMGAAGWALYGEAIKKYAESLPSGVREVISDFADIGGNGMLRAVANGEISSEKERSIARKNADVLVDSGMSQEGAKVKAQEYAAGIASNRSQDASQAEKAFAKIGVDLYNVR
jgi:hypothetical protein